MTRVILAAVLVLAGGAARGDSIWERATGKGLYTDDVARNVGDVLTISINERSKIESETTRNLEKSTDSSAKVSGTFDPAGQRTGRHVFNLPQLDVSAVADNKFDGKAKYDSDRTVTDQITVVVEDVLPNGNLIVLGRRKRVIAGEEQTITISGIVRVSDITFGNTVRSEQVADFHVVYTTKGQENLFTRPGWLMRILNFLNPF